MIDNKRRRIRVAGVVQGVGFRPFVWRYAYTFNLVGWVKNDSAGVTIEVQGKEAQVDAFINSFQDAIPPLARIDSMTVTEMDPVSESEFLIAESLVTAKQSTPISPEISICDDCLCELQNRNNRRFGYPFINCTNCGPRFTIVEDIPYDRPLTTMKSFPMCGDCQREYDDPSNRRFHAQPNACWKCGPTIWMADDTNDGKFERPSLVDSDDSAFRRFRSAIEQGLVVAVKGIGGFHLVCDATNETAIARLRERKGRVEKPFAVMVRDVEDAVVFAEVTDQERDLLESVERPIVLLNKRRRPFDKDVSQIAARSEPIAEISDLVAPANNCIGVMLPYSPLHYLLIGESPLVFTSGNVMDESIVRTNAEARNRLGKLADRFLLHDREINVVCDDSVVRCVDGEILPIRRSRGFAPMPVKTVSDGPSVLAVGGEIKSTFCVLKDDYAYLSQHIGDMGNLETLEAMRRSVDHFLRLFRVDVEAVAADLHPGYLSGQWANELAKSLGVPLIRVQHHFAHVAALIAEHGLPCDEQIIGCCFDGTGYGTDEAIWGGEFMVANGMTFDRFAQLHYLPLPGGDASIRRPYRVALAQLWENGIDWNEELPCVAACPAAERKLLRQQLEKNLNCVPTSSMGRLFDAVASLIGVRHEISYEAQAAMEFEALAATAINHVDPNAYSFQIQRTSITEINNSNLLSQMCAEVQSAVDRSVIAARFHHAVANAVVNVCQLAREENSISTVGLTGGVFQNVVLLRLTRKRLVESGFQVLTHSIVPPNDGGIALGQALVARNQLQEQFRV